MHSTSFGLYEDDLTIIPRIMKMEANAFLDLVKHDFLILHPHGRPLSNTFIYIFSFLGFQTSNLHTLYILAFGILSINLLVFYALLRRLMDPYFALIGGISFALFSADTTQAFLTHAYGLHPALFFLLLALHSYMSKKRILAYVFGLLVLFTYESPFLILFVAPLLIRKWDRKVVKELIIHGIILVGMMASVHIFRTIVGDFRTEVLTFPTIITTPIVHMIQGPIVTLGTYFYRPIQALSTFDAEIGGVSLLLFILFITLFMRLFPDIGEKTNTFLRTFQTFRPRQIWEAANRALNSNEVPPAIEKGFKLLIVGFTMLVLAYPVTFTVRGYAISGRDTRVHFAAVVGGSIVWASAGWLLFVISNAYGRKMVAIVALSGIFALLGGYGILLQRDYTTAWEYERNFWTDIVHLVPDLKEDDVILVEPEGFQYVRQITPTTWNLPRVLEQIYSFPDDWNDVPHVYRLIPGWKKIVLNEAGEFMLNASTVLSPLEHRGNVLSSNITLIEFDDGVLVRRTGPLNIDGKDFPLRGPSGSDTDYEKNILFDLLIQNE